MLVCGMFLFCSQATWLNGNNLAQTIFTCLYVHDLSAVKDPIIKVRSSVVFLQVLLISD